MFGFDHAAVGVGASMAPPTSPKRGRQIVRRVAPANPNGYRRVRDELAISLLQLGVAHLSVRAEVL